MEGVFASGVGAISKTRIRFVDCVAGYFGAECFGNGVFGGYFSDRICAVWFDVYFVCVMCVVYDYYSGDIHHG